MPKGVTSPEIMRLRGQAGAYALHSRYDSAQTARKAQAGLQRKLAKEFDPDGRIERTDPVEFARRLKCAVSAHMKKVSLAKVRKAKAEAGAAAAAKAAERQLRKSA